jgi:hypothetical protein
MGRPATEHGRSGKPSSVPFTTDLAGEPDLRPERWVHVWIASGKSQRSVEIATLFGEIARRIRSRLSFRNPAPAQHAIYKRLRLPPSYTTSGDTTRVRILERDCLWPPEGFDARGKLFEIVADRAVDVSASRFTVSRSQLSFSSVLASRHCRSSIKASPIRMVGE